MLNQIAQPDTVFPNGVERRAGLSGQSPWRKPQVDRNGMDDQTGTERPCPQTEWMIAVRDRRDRAAFARLFDHYGPRLKAVAMRGGASAAEAEDIVQDVMLTIWHKARYFDASRAQVSAWIYRIARNRQIDLFRRRARPEPEEITGEERNAEDAAEAVALDQEAAQLRAALARLNPDQRQMIEKAYLGEMTHVEIQEETGLPLGTIKSRLRLGLERLRHELKELRKA